MTQWITDWYAIVDQMDVDALAEVTSPDITVTFANFPTTEGFPAFAASLEPLWGSLDSMTHSPVRLWEIPGTDYGAIEATIAYGRKDGKVVHVPSFSSVHRGADGKIDELNVYIDLAPVFA